jgi:hypothetical protein
MKVESEIMKGYLVIDDVDAEEAERIIKQLKKSGRWMSQEAMKKEMDAVGFAVFDTRISSYKTT